MTQKRLWRSSLGPKSEATSSTSNGAKDQADSEGTLQKKWIATKETEKGTLGALKAEKETGETTMTTIEKEEGKSPKRVTKTLGEQNMESAEEEAEAALVNAIVDIDRLLILHTRLTATREVGTKTRSISILQNLHLL